MSDEEKLETKYSTIPTFPFNTTHPSSQNIIDNPYFDLMLSLKEKNNNLLISLQEMSKIKDENFEIHKNLKELEFSFFLVKDENK